ncbi:uncharacterized protein C8Q71DRAFT_782259 [Rhodofomes roseus]|uniref:C2H2-type domain-containing protein n=1 Tax=Rhodofomes roseus TaxID=34475 RepID=A0ABQ8K3B4_9APHY|nr:uncharacterized protein C8Q71DRAFT_782259 [Rhodofomes roseus]KAH9831379.1 hypothetical protein C8Q71DRAFT_782259 [Rhodofomes roseus]
MSATQYMQYDSDQGVYTSSVPDLLLSAESLSCRNDSLPRDYDGFMYDNWSADGFLPYSDVLGFDPLMDTLRGPSDILAPYSDLSQLCVDAALYSVEDLQPFVEGSSAGDYRPSTSWTAALQNPISVEPSHYTTFAPIQGPSDTSTSADTVPSASYMSSPLEWPPFSSPESPSETLCDTHSPATSSPTAADSRSATSDRSSKRLPRARRSSIRRGHARPSNTATDPSYASGGVRRTSPRNKQVGFVPYARIDAHHERSDCRHCSFSTTRKGDLERHERTHFAHICDPELVCCGLPEEEAPVHQGVPYEYGGRRMVGGCMKTFSRRDSFLRHLKKATCFRPAHM